MWSALLVVLLGMTGCCQVQSNDKKCPESVAQEIDVSSPPTIERVKTTEK